MSERTTARHWRRKGGAAADHTQDLDNLSTAYGSEADLRKCLAALRARNVLAIADVVINHRCAQQKVGDRGLVWEVSRSTGGVAQPGREL